MKDILINPSILNGPMMIYVKDNQIYIQVYQKEYTLTMTRSNTPNDIRGVVVHRKGPYPYIITSDIFDVNKLQYEDNIFNEETIYTLFVSLLEASIQFIATISQNEDTAVLVQNTFSEEKKYFLSTIGLIDDIRIIFADIKIKESEASQC
jgi:hypothetical protein